MPRGAAPVLDRLITLVFPGPPVEDRYGHDKPMGEPRRETVWAKRMDAAPRDQLDWDNDARLNVNTAVFIIRWRSDVDAVTGQTKIIAGQLNIIDDEGQTRCVIGRAQTERRMRHLALLCESIR